MPNYFWMIEYEVGKGFGAYGAFVEPESFSNSPIGMAAPKSTHDEKANTTLGDEVGRIYNHGVNCITESIQRQQCGLEIPPSMRRQEAGDIFEQHDRGAPACHFVEDAHKTPVSGGLHAAQAFSLSRQ